jgi:hypothetical protein
MFTAAKKTINSSRLLDVSDTLTRAFRGAVLCSFVYLSAAGAVGESPATVAGGVKTGTLHIASERPPATRLFIDGAPLTTQEVELTPGAHQLVAVASGFYGQSRTLKIDAGKKRNVTVILQATSLATPGVVERFLVLADSDAISMGDVQSMPDHTLRVALRGKLLNQQHNTYALQQLRRDLVALTEKDDTRGAVAGFLVDATVAGKFGESSFYESLLAAAQRNDPMASFFHAVALRENLRSAADISPSAPQFVSYCAELGRARSQGWADMAATWQQRDSCPQ